MNKTLDNDLTEVSSLTVTDSKGTAFLEDLPMTDEFGMSFTEQPSKVIMDDINIYCCCCVAGGGSARI